MLGLPLAHDQNAVRQFTTWVRQRTVVKATVVCEGKTVEQFVGVAVFVEPNASLVAIMNAAKGQRTFKLENAQYTVLEGRVIATTIGWTCVIFDQVSGD